VQLKKLVIKGFKSFAEKTTLEFTDGVTAVVGPNGSGKSNIIEAIQWVMGEQSAKSLRGGKMNDVIFSGTENRKPMNIAEVTIILDNTSGFLPIDFGEVSVTRRLSQSGESDYFINKQSCRLKDIIELFMDSGLGKESFSVISQGQVESVFNSKPEDRRKIFEEAAGVFKYKMSKEQAEKKLENTQDNLDRVQDILYELEAQVEPLRAQADIAESYLSQKEELTDLDIGLTVVKINQLRDQMDQFKKDLKQYEEKLTGVDAELKEKKQALTQVKNHLSEIEEQRENLRRDIVQKVQEIERTESSLALHEEKTKHKEEFIQEKKQSIGKQKEQINLLQEQIDQKTSEAKDQQDLVNKSNTQIMDKKKRLGYLEEGAEERIEELRSDYLEFMQSQASLNNEDQSLNREISRQSIQDEKAADQKKALESDLEVEKEKLETKTKNLETTQEEIDSLLEDFQRIEKESQSFNDNYQAKLDRLQKLRNQLEQAKAKRSSLSEMKDNYAGYFAGVKAVMKNKDQISGLVGTVADLIQIPEKYLEAIDTVLGSSSQFVVVEDEKAGRRAIKYLKDRRAGRATFLPLTTIKARHIQKQWINNAQDVPGFIGIASDLIDYDTSVSNIVGNLLGNTIVAATLEAANKIARAVSYRCRIVSLDGNVMNAGGSMTGGGGKRSSNSHIFTQKDELKKLTIFIDETMKTIKHEQAVVEQNVQENESYKKEMDRVRQAGEEKRYLENQLENEIKSAEESVHQLERQLEALSFEMEERSSELADNEQRLQEVKAEKETVKEKIEATTAEITELRDAKKDSEARKEELNTEISDLQAVLSGERERLASIRSTLSNLENQRDQNKQTLDQLVEDVKAYEEGQVLGSKEDLLERLDYLNQAYESQQKQDQYFKEKLAELNKSEEDLEAQVTQLQGRQQYFNEEKNSIDVQLSRTDVNMDHLLEYLVDEYGQSYEEARLMPDLELSFEEAEKKVKLLKKGIDELGPVNIHSIDEYKKVSERYEFLSKQQQDLIEAKSQLFDTMDEMDNEVRRRFKAKFDEIKAEFSSVFPKMFGGGKAELRLTDPDDLLNTGVDIVAQPPGKKLSVLSLLSGGERALTAISLLFSIVQVSEVPFCILDEAEAALDESNVERFGKYLQNFETDTQFIVITHRKGTMEQSDSLYGITMQEQGISKLVSVRLEEVDEMGIDGD